MNDGQDVAKGSRDAPEAEQRGCEREQDHGEVVDDPVGSGAEDLHFQLFQSMVGSRFVARVESCNARAERLAFFEHLKATVPPPCGKPHRTRAAALRVAAT